MGFQLKSWFFGPNDTFMKSEILRRPLVPLHHLQVSVHGELQVQMLLIRSRSTSRLQNPITLGRKFP